MAAQLQQPLAAGVTSPKGSAVANSFIATVYFKQATTLLDHGQYAEAEAYYREALRIWPDHSASLNNLGTAVLRQGRIDEAEACHRRALELNPVDYAILNNLGNVLWEQGRLDDAVRYYRQAVELRPDSAEALMNFGVNLCDLGELEEALGYIRESLRLMPGSALCHLSLGNLFARQGKLDDALACYEQALRLRPDFPEVRRNRSYVWLNRGDFERGWAEYEWRLKCEKQRISPMNSPRWNGENLESQSILLVAEQGLGDTLQFIRFAQAVKQRSGQVTFACPAPLLRLVARCPGVDQVVDWKSPPPQHDIHVALMSLPAILGTTLASIPDKPYLSVDKPTIKQWRPIVARALSRGTGRAGDDAGSSPRAFKVGVAWQGNRGNTVDRSRSFPLYHFAHVARVPGVRLISLQKGYGTEQLTELGGRFSIGELVDRENGEGDRRDFLDTAAVMTQLDLVVTADSAVAHLAGGLGVTVWLALPAVAEWRWLIDRDDSPWYPTMRLFRQTSPGDWDSVFKRMAQMLEQMLVV
jgi:tetratricopeptide (TPR) repeat protein